MPLLYLLLFKYSSKKLLLFLFLTLKEFLKSFDYFI